MLGARAVGKSSLTIRFISDIFLDEYEPTTSSPDTKIIPLNIPNDTFLSYGAGGSGQIMLDILDHTGREEFAWYLDQWIREGEVIVLVFDVSRSFTFEEIQILREHVM